jgi:predicted GIY-YIG superfamily endonuclease
VIEKRTRDLDVCAKDAFCADCHAAFLGGVDDVRPHRSSQPRGGIEQLGEVTEIRRARRWSRPSLVRQTSSKRRPWPCSCPGVTRIRHCVRRERGDSWPLKIAGWSSLVARQAHNLKAAGSNPAPATNPSPVATYRVYVLRNEEGRRYVGLSENSQLRLQQHNADLSKWTRNKGPWRMVWQSTDLSLSEARNPENKLKRQKGGRGLDHLLGSQGS